MKKNQLIIGLGILVVFVTVGIYAQHRYQFDWHEVIAQFKRADWRKIGIATGCIYLAYVFRSVRWAYLLRHTKKVGPFSLLGTQVIGFTAVALIGRIADPVRPYLLAKKTGLPLANQVAVYIVERLFDAGAMALVFSNVLSRILKGNLSSSIERTECSASTHFGPFVATQSLDARQTSYHLTQGP